jgi:hypothetical protein
MDGDTLGGRRNAHQPNIASEYSHSGRGLQELRRIHDHRLFPPGLQSLKALSQEVAKRKENVAIMCSETLWWRCHRRMVADQLVSEGWAVRHLASRRAKPDAYDVGYFPHCGGWCLDIR